MLVTDAGRAVLTDVPLVVRTDSKVGDNFVFVDVTVTMVPLVIEEAVGEPGASFSPALLIIGAGRPTRA